MKRITSIDEATENKYYIRISRNFLGNSYLVIKTMPNYNYWVWEFENINDIYNYFRSVINLVNDRVRPCWKSRIKVWLSRNTGSVYEVDVYSKEDVEIFGTMHELVN